MRVHDSVLSSILEVVDQPCRHILIESASQQHRAGPRQYFRHMLEIPYSLKAHVEWRAVKVDEVFDSGDVANRGHQHWNLAGIVDVAIAIARTLEGERNMEWLIT